MAANVYINATCALKYTIFNIPKFSVRNVPGNNKFRQSLRSRTMAANVYINATCALKYTIFNIPKFSVRNVPGLKCCRKLHQGKPSAPKWQLMSAVCLERFPVITQQMNPREAEFNALLRKMEFEYSCYSDHTLRHLEDLKLSEKKKQEDYEETEADSVRVTAQELEDAWEDELEAFIPAPRTTDADKTNDLRSVDRKLDRKLILFVKQKLGDSSHLVLPMGKRKEGESMRQAAERVLSFLCGPDLRAAFLSNAPCGFIKYKFPPTAKDVEDFVGAKIFFYKAQFQDGSPTPHKDIISDFQWLCKDEIDQFVTEPYGKRIKKFILDF